MPCRVSKEEFGRIIQSALSELPEPFASAVESIRIEVRGRPTARMLRDAEVPPGETLLGLYQGRPTTQRSVEDSGSLPDVILLFQEELEDICEDEEELAQEIRRTVLHELGHHYGMDEDGLGELGYG